MIPGGMLSPREGGSGLGLGRDRVGKMLSPGGVAIFLGGMLSADEYGSGPGRNAKPWRRQHPRGQEHQLVPHSSSGMWLRASARRCLRLTTLSFGRELMLSFLHKTKATGFYLWGESGFCEMQKASAPGQERMRLAGRKGIRLLSALVVGGAGTAPLAAPACHCPCSTTCLSLSHACAPCTQAVKEGKSPMGQRAEKRGP